MLVLSTTGDNIELVLGAAVTTSQPQCFAAWRDITTTAFAPGRLGVNANSTTAVNIVPAPAGSTQRVVDFISVYNADTKPVEATIRFDLSGAETILFKGWIGVGEVLVYVDGSGWHKIGSNGEYRASARGNADVQTFSTPGIGRWVKPTTFEPKVVIVKLWGAGGGGGGAAGAAITTAAKGGGGGGGGSFNMAIMPASMVGGVEPVVIGRGGEFGVGGGTGTPGSGGG